MFCKFLLPALVLAKLVTASDELPQINAQENALANAVRSKNGTVLTALTDKNFHVSWHYGSGIRIFQVDMGRQDWIDDLSHLRIGSYDIEISKVQWADRNQGHLGVYASITEFWTLGSPSASRIENRVESRDLWVKEGGAWKLMSRLCLPNQSSRLLPLR